LFLCDTTVSNANYARTNAPSRECWQGLRRLREPSFQAVIRRAPGAPCTAQP
jgi:hypothetical protein